MLTPEEKDHLTQKVEEMYQRLEQLQQHLEEHQEKPIFSPGETTEEV